MRELRFRIVNVFTLAGSRLSGNALAVFEDASSLEAPEMAALARQMNLSESAFLLPPTEANLTAHLRIFTPQVEMPFAGHPTLGAAAVVSELTGQNEIAFAVEAGRVTVKRQDGGWALRAPLAPTTRAVQATRDELGAMLGLTGASIADDPLWVHTGVEQLVIPLRATAEVKAVRPRADLMERFAHDPRSHESVAYVWARESSELVTARCFFMSHGAVVEDAATGSACANLGGYLVANGHQLPVAWTIHQGEEIGRPSQLSLGVDAEGQITVQGRVVEIGRGVIEL